MEPDTIDTLDGLRAENAALRERLGVARVIDWNCGRCDLPVPLADLADDGQGVMLCAACWGVIRGAVEAPAQAHEPGPVLGARHWCPLCGRVDTIDEDGCCPACGADTGPVPDTLEERLRAIAAECDGCAHIAVWSDGQALADCTGMRGSAETDRLTSTAAAVDALVEAVGKGGADTPTPWPATAAVAPPPPPRWVKGGEA